MSRIRIDKYLHENGFATSRTKAQELIANGRVSLHRPGDTKVVKDSSEAFDPTNDWQISIAPDPSDRFVSRGGLKMEGALNKIQLNPQQMTILDLGISTGGFSDCLLQHGAKHIVGIDVGHGQLAEKLRQDPRIDLLEGVNAREFGSNSQFAKFKDVDFDLVVCDLSFISLKLIAPELAKCLKLGSKVLCLVKPQFEVGPENIGKGGIVKDGALYIELEQQMKRTFQENGFMVISYFDSPIEGKDGNREFFLFAEKC